MELDRLAEEKGVEAIAPLCGLPIPVKGTAAVVDYPSGSGVGILTQYTVTHHVPTQDNDLTALIKARNGIIFGTTNATEFAASVLTANPANGITRKPVQPCIHT